LGKTLEVTETSPGVPQRLPFALIGASLVAFGGLFVTAEHFLGLPVLGLMLVGVYMTGWRLAANRRMRWGIRFVAFAIIVAVVGLPRGDIPLWYMKPEYTNVIGILLAAELVLRAWQRIETAKWGQNNGIILFLSAIIITAASNTYDRQPMHTIIPVYVLLVAFSLRSIGRTTPLSEKATPRGKTLLGMFALRGVALLVAMSLGFTVVFLLTRYDNRLTSWAMQFLRQDRAVKGSSIGLNSAPRLKRIFNPQPSLERVLLIDGSASARHLRVMSFDVYQNSEWRPTATVRTFTTASADRINVNSSGPRLQINRLADDVDVLPVPADASAVQAAGPLDVDDFGSLRDHEPNRLSFSVIVQPTQKTIPLAKAPDAAQRARALFIPPAIDPKVVELARQIAKDSDPAARVARISLYLTSHHDYSLSYDPGSDEPLNDFVLNHRAAHCQYFASAVVMMARAVGVPARMATGYYAHEHFGDNQIIVRDRDAHAWAECWIEGQGWITVDAAPSGGRPDTAYPEASKWRQWWEWFTDLPGRLREWLGEIPREKLVGLIVIAAGIVVLVWVVKILRKRRRVRPGDVDGYLQPSEELAAVGRRFELWLRRQNLPCSPARTWREHLASLRAQPSQPIDTAAPLRFVEAYDKARFGGIQQFLAQLKTALDQLETTPSQTGSRHHG